jgi:hypothetical protein
MADGKKTYRMGASAVGPDQGAGGTGVGQRLIPEEPMSIIFNLGISREFSFVRQGWSCFADACCRKLADD